jgi:hypothetical protein
MTQPDARCFCRSLGAVVVTTLLCAGIAAVSGCAAHPSSAEATSLREVFPGVRVDASRRVVEFDGAVPVDAHNPKFPRVYLEVVVSTPDTRPHEALVVTTAKAAQIHAALLLAGFKPGAPGGWSRESGSLRPIAPTGDALRVWLVTRDARGTELVQSAESWVAVMPDGTPLGGKNAGEGWVFAGSRLRPAKQAGEPDQYLADAEGTIVGLTTFTTETIAWSGVFSPDSKVQEPEWIARPERVPKVNTPVTVRITPAAASSPEVLGR